MIIRIETDIVAIATSEDPDKFFGLFDDLDDLATMLDANRAEYLLEALLKRFEEPVIEVTLENIPLILAA